MRDRFSRISLGAGILMIAVAAGHAFCQDEEAAAPRSLTVDDYFRILTVDEPQISPDGKWVAYTVTTSDIEKDESTSRIWMVPAAGGEPVPMTAKEKSASQPRWSPDGQFLSFLAAPKDGKDQVWTLFREGGEAVQLTDTAQDVSEYEWSPDGKRVVLVLQDPTPAELAEKKGEKKEKNPPPWVVTRRQFKQDYIGYLDSRRTHLYIFDVASKTMTQITSGDYDDSEPDWSPDGRHIAFTSNRTADPDSNYNSDIWVVAADNTDLGQTLLQITTNPGPDTSPDWSPDGDLIAHSSATDTDAIIYATNHLAIASAKGGRATVLTQKLDRNIFNPRFSHDGRAVLAAIEDSGEQYLASVPIDGGAITHAIGGHLQVAAFDVAAGKVAAIVSKPHLPAEVFLLDDEGLRRLTHTNDEVMATSGWVRSRTCASRAVTARRSRVSSSNHPASRKVSDTRWCYASTVGRCRSTISAFDSRASSLPARATWWYCRTRVARRATGRTSAPPSGRAGAVSISTMSWPRSMTPSSADMQIPSGWWSGAGPTAAY